MNALTFKKLVLALALGPYAATRYSANSNDIPITMTAVASTSRSANTRRIGKSS
jgi:hypothetical protein